MAKKRWPKTLLALRVDDDFIGVSEISEEYADEPIGVYELIAVGKLSVEKQVEAKPVKKRVVGYELFLLNRTVPEMLSVLVVRHRKATGAGTSFVDTHASISGPAEGWRR
jgi:hypothetical protein